MIAMQHAGFPEHSSEFLLVRGQPIAIRAEAGDTLHVFSGVIWMTDGSATDYILHAGELFRLRKSPWLWCKRAKKRKLLRI